MDLVSVRRAYRRYAPVYDILFGPAMNMGRIATVHEVNRLAPRRVLEVGVGTGLALPRYRRDCAVTGIDVSREMLALARRRVERRRLTHVEQILEMDAQSLAFPDAHFDVVVAMFVMSVVPDPVRCLAEMRRVCRADGAILICNHFFAPERSAAWITRSISPFARSLGWRPDFTLDTLLDDGLLTVVSRQPVPPFGLFSLLECRK
ncbi:MAG: class I SAM-dependent methyltransferase [Alphaproteobacteria bacterium]